MKDLEKIKAEIDRRITICAEQREEMLNNQCNTLADDASARMGELNCLLDFINSLPEEQVSEDLEEAVNNYIGYAPEVDESVHVYGERMAFKAGAQWQKEQDQKDIELAEDHAYLAGADWQRNHVWHEASEVPDQSKDLCALYSNGKFDFFEHIEGLSYNNYWTAVNQSRAEKGCLLTSGLISPTYSLITNRTMITEDKTQKALIEQGNKALGKAKTLEGKRLAQGWRYVKITERIQVLVPHNKEGKPTKQGLQMIEHHKKMWGVK